MKVGFARADITPSPGVHLCGQLDPVRAHGVESRLYATAMCLEEAGTKALFCSCDVLAIPTPLSAAISEQAAKAARVPGDNIVIATTHTHSGPNTVDIFGKDANPQYMEDLKRDLVTVLSRAALNTRQARLSFAEGQLAGYAFNRRFVMSDGTIQTHPLKLDPHIIAAEGPDSTRLDVLYASDGGGRPLGAAIGFGCHGTVMPRDNTMISSDYPGKAAASLSAALGGDATVLFMPGASGNICQVNPLDASRKELGAPWAETMGRAVADKASELIREDAVAARGPLRVIRETIRIPRREIPAELIRWAERHDNTGAQPPALSNYGTERFGELHGGMVSLAELFATPFWADFYANEIKTLQGLRAREQAVAFSITVVCQDNWALVALPCELFVEWSDAIRSRSPFGHTMVVELANGWHGYVPTRRAFERPGGYETKELTSTILVPEAGEMILRTVVSMLETAKG